VAEYTLDAETGIASSPTERMANFFKGIFLDNLSTKVNFKNRNTTINKNTMYRSVSKSWCRI